MEFSMDNPLLFSHHQLEPSYPMEMQVLPNQATESSGIYPIFEELASEALPPPVPPISGHGYTSPASNLPPPLNHPNQAQSFQLPSDVQDIAAPPILPPTKMRKRKAPKLTAEAWNPYKDRIVELHIEQNLPLSKVKETMEKEFGFTAGIRQYRTRISQWRLDKNVKTNEMRAIVRKRQQRKLVEPNKRELVFAVRENIVEPEKVDRWMRRNKISESIPYAPSPDAPTPSDVWCRTISERASLVPSPIPSARTPTSATSVIGSIVQSPHPPSPALSESSVIRSTTSTFTGRSPAPIRRPLPHFPKDPAAPHTFSTTSQGDFFNGVSKSFPEVLTVQAEPLPRSQMINAPKLSVEFRYRQEDEARLRRELSSLETQYGKDRPKTLFTLGSLAVVLGDQGRFKSAEGMIRRVIIASRKWKGDSDINTLMASIHLGDIWVRQGQYVKGEEILRSTWESLRDMHGHEHRYTLDAMRSLAMSILWQQRLKEAEEMLVWVLERMLNQKDSSTWKTMYHLGQVYSRQGRLKEAEELQKKLMDMILSMFGPDHPSILRARAALGITYANQGYLQKAAEIQAQVLETLKSVLGPGHPNTLASMEHLSITWIRQSRKSEALELIFTCFQLSTEVLGANHPFTVNRSKLLDDFMQGE